MTVIVRVVETCPACPSQWDAWDDQGRYWYLRYRHGRGTAEIQPGPDTSAWSDKPPEIAFETGRGRLDGFMDLAEFAEFAGMVLPGKWTAPGSR